MPRANPDLPPITGDCLELVITFGSTAAAQLPQIRIGYTTNAFAGAGLAADVQAFAAAWRTAVETQMLACLPVNVTVQSYLVQAVSRADVRSSRSVPVGAAGTVTGSHLTANVATVIQRGCPVKGQHGRGRLSMPFVPGSFTTPATAPDILNATGISAYGAFIAALFGTGGAPTQIVVNTHPFVAAMLQRPVLPSTVVSLASVILPAFCVLDIVFGTIRNRLRRRR